MLVTFLRPFSGTIHRPVHTAQLKNKLKTCCLWLCFVLNFYTNHGVVQEDSIKIWSSWSCVNTRHNDQTKTPIPAALCCRDWSGHCEGHWRVLYTLLYSVFCTCTSVLRGNSQSVCRQVEERTKRLYEICLCLYPASDKPGTDFEVRDVTNVSMMSGLVWSGSAYTSFSSDVYFDFTALQSGLPRNSPCCVIYIRRNDAILSLFLNCYRGQWMVSVARRNSDCWSSASGIWKLREPSYLESW